MRSALHLVSPSAHAAGVSTPTTARALPQYPETDERIRAIARSVVNGDVKERSGRFACWEEVARTDLVPASVNHWLAKNAGRGIGHLRSDLIARAEDWVARAITGEMLDASMRDVGSPASLISLQRVADGASVVGYLRLAIRRQMPNILRGHLRANTTTHAGTELADFSLGEDPARKCDSDQRGNLSYRDLVKAAGVTNHDDEQVRERIAVFNARTWGKSTHHRSWELGQMAEAVCSVPPGRRPLGRSERHRMLTALSKDHLLARRALSGHDDVLAPVFSHFTNQDCHNVLDSKMPDVWAYALAQAALDDRPRPAREVISGARRQVAERAMDAGVGRGVVKRVMDAIFAAEFGQGLRAVPAHPELSYEPSWVELIEPICRDHPEVFGPDPASARQFVLDLTMAATDRGAA